MRKIVECIFLLCVTATPCFAKDVDPKRWRVDPASTKILRTVKDCNFTIANFPNHGQYRYGGYTFLDDSTYMGHGFGIACYSGQSAERIQEYFGAKLVDGVWIYAGTREPFTEDLNFEVLKLNGQTWTGMALVYDTTFGDEDTRPRHFIYCLLERSGPQVLCGETSIMTVGAPISTSILPGILTVLQTIEFVKQPAESGPVEPSKANP